VNVENFHFITIGMNESEQPIEWVGLLYLFFQRIFSTACERRISTESIDSRSRTNIESTQTSSTKSRDHSTTGLHLAFQFQISFRNLCILGHRRQSLRACPTLDHRE